MYKLFIFVLIGFILFFCGCASVTMYHEPFPALKSAQQINVFNANKPDKEYIEICEIKCDFGSDSINLNKAKEKASKVGADAIILMGGVGYTGSGTVHEYGLKAIAIRYK